jgi:hypothetical protein
VGSCWRPWPRIADTEFAVRAVDHCIALFEKAPRAYAYDRGGHSLENVAELKKEGVKEVGLAPRGRVAWAVAEEMKEKLVRERALVEAGIGTPKTRRFPGIGLGPTDRCHCWFGLTGGGGFPLGSVAGCGNGAG